MKRRTAIRNIALASGAIAFLPGCEIAGPTGYANIPLDSLQMRALEHLSKRILPTEGLELGAPESTIDYIMTVINDCFAPEKIQQFATGFTELETWGKEKLGAKLHKLSEEEGAQLLTYLETGEGVSENVKMMYDSTKGLTKQHFTSSPYFLQKHTDWQFIPGTNYRCEAV